MSLDDEKRARDEALARVAANSGEWFPRAVAVAPLCLPDTPFLPEDLHGPIIALIGKPHHHNCWGSLTKNLLTGKRIVPTGSWRPMRATGSHARLTREYRRA